MIAVRCHEVASDNSGSMRGDALSQAIQSDTQQGLIPFFVRFFTTVFRDFGVGSVSVWGWPKMKFVLLTPGSLPSSSSSSSSSSRTRLDSPITVYKMDIDALHRHQHDIKAS